MNLKLKPILNVLRHSSVALSFGVAVTGLAQDELTRQLSAIKSAEHSVIFSRVSDGKVLFEHGADTSLSPASVTKLITSAAVLHYYGPSFSLKTPVFYTGAFNQGKISGDLWIKGTGDPFLVSELLWQMVVDLKHLGVREVNGSIRIDNSIFDKEDRDESRIDSVKKSSHAYDAPVSAFAVNFNTVAVATIGTKPGQPAFAQISPLPLRSVRLVNRTSTTKGDNSSGVTLTRNTSQTGSISLLSGGAIGAEAPLKKIYRSVGDPTLTAGDYVAAFLQDGGIRVKGGVKEGVVPDHAKLLYELSGFEMRRIAQGLNTFSNNFIADMLTKRLGASLSNPDAPDRPGSGKLSSGAKALESFLVKDVGVKGAVTILNGSGLATENRLSSRQVLTLLNWMEKRGDLYPDYLASLPATGWDGTVKKRLKQSEDLAGLIRAKSGTLTEPITVAALAGYFRHPKEGWVSFSIISNGRDGKPQPGLGELRNLQDNVLKGILTR
jgi:D-alanyl-D-alanine carboxypeptidase/D-alanyl-D-alanine-endopeptidase (penicillin-binding protein 4)